MPTLTALGATHGFTAGDLDTSGQVAVQPAYQRVYFADGRPYDDDITLSGYHVLDFINTRINSDTDPTNFGALPEDDWVKGDVVSQTHIAGDPSEGIFDDVIEVSTGVFWVLIYRTGVVEFTTDADIDVANKTSLVCAGGNINSVTAPPHWLNWVLTDGVFPDGGSNILSLCWGRIFMNSIQNPHQWFATRMNDPLDLALVVDDVGAAQNSQASDKAGLVGDQILAMIPYKGNTQVFGCLNNMFVMRADPAKGGFFTTLSDSTGIFSNTSYCWDDKNNLYFVGNDGIYALSADSIINGLPPTNLTKDNAPKLISQLGLNRRTDRIVMAYDKDRYGIEVSVSQLDGEWSAQFWVDLRTGGVFPETYSEDHIPTVLSYFNSRVKSERTLLAGCNDGYIRKWDDDEKSDDGSVAIDSKVLIGPIASQNIRAKVKMNELSVKTGVNTDNLTVSIYSGTTGEHLVKNVEDEESPKITKNFNVDKLLPSVRQQISDGAIGIMLSNDTVDSSWSMEKIDADISEIGRIK